MKFFISHRGNLVGKNYDLENKPSYIDSAINEGFYVEIDLWVKNNKLYLGHDEPQYEIDEQFLLERKKHLWIHCKNYEAILYFNSNKFNYNYFWHQSDDITLTSKKYIWVYPGKQPINNSIAVLPEIYEDDLSKCNGICSDYIKKYKEKWQQEKDQHNPKTPKNQKRQEKK